MVWFERRDDGREREGPPLARTEAEAALYMTVHPCECGDRTPPELASIGIDHAGRSTKEYAARCPTCGRPRRFSFTGPADPLADVGLFGEGVSELLDPGEWLWAAEQSVNSFEDPDTAVAFAIAAIQEAIKFIPPGQRAIPRSALRSERSLAMLAADPETFEFDRMRARFRTGFGGSAARPTAPRRVALRAEPVRLPVPGRCPAGSFSPDGSEIAVASGFQQINGVPEGEVAVFATTDGRLLHRHPSTAYTVRVLHTGDGVLVADWQVREGRLAAGELVRHSAHSHQVLLEYSTITHLVHTPAGFAALNSEGEVLLGTGRDIRRLPAPGPRACLACDPVSGRIAVGGDELVLLDADGRRLADMPTPVGLLAVAFLGPDRLLVSGPGVLAVWRLDDDGELVLLTKTDAVRRLGKLAALPRRGLVVGIDRDQWMTVVEVADEALRVLETPSGLHGRDVWASPSGELLALPDRINEWLPPAPEQVEVHDTRVW